MSELVAAAAADGDDIAAANIADQSRNTLAKELEILLPQK